MIHGSGSSKTEAMLSQTLASPPARSDPSRPALLPALSSPGLNPSQPSHPRSPLRAGMRQVMLTLRQAAEQAKPSRSSLHRDIQRGVISVTRTESGQILIDP